MSKLVEHAERELRIAGLFDPDADYGGALAHGVMRLVKVFAGEDHSGFSAGMTADILDKLLRFKPLTPVTADPAEWLQVGDSSLHCKVSSPAPLWQNTRHCSCFSNDGGKTHYDVDAQDMKTRPTTPVKS